MVRTAQSDYHRRVGRMEAGEWPLEEVKGSHVNNAQHQHHWAVILDKP